MVAPPAPPASSTTLVTAIQSSTNEWRDDMQKLFQRAKERFPDVVWELGDDPDNVEEIWGHKAIVYARAPPSFQARYFKFRPAPSPTPTPYGASPLPGHSQSAYSLNLPLEDMTPGSRSPSPYAARRIMSPTPSQQSPDGVLRLQTNIAPVLFTNELEYLYTGKGLSDAFEFLFKATEQELLGSLGSLPLVAQEDKETTEEDRVEKLRNDLIYMWRSRLYSDVRIMLSGTFPASRESAPGEQATAVFSSHKFILVSRSQYFRERLQSIVFSNSGNEAQLDLPSPPFTPASVHFTLGFIYTGTLSFSHRTFDLTTAFHIFRSATYLQLDALYKEMEARLVEEMMHGLFHAFLTFDHYERITAGRWGVGGCKCKQCQRRAPRVLAFAMSPDVNNPILTRGAQRALSGMFGEGWCSQDFIDLPVKTRSNLVKGVTLRCSAMNAVPLLFAAQSALTRLENSQEVWAEDVREMIHAVRKKIDEVICSQCEEVFEQEEWVSILERHGAEFGDNEKVGWVMDSIMRGLNEKNAPLVYQILVSAVLLRPDPTTGSALIPQNSFIRSAVERTREAILKWMKDKYRWQMVHAAGGFEEIDSWAIKEISDEIDVPYEVLIAPRAGAGPGRPGPAVPNKSYGDTESASINSFRPSARGSTTDLTNPNKKEATPSMHSLSRASVTSTRAGRRPSLPSAPPPAPSATSRNQPAARLKPILSSRVQSTISQPSNAAPSIKGSDGRGRQSKDVSDSASMTSYTRSTPPGTPKSPAPPLPGLRTPPADEHPLPPRPKSTVSVKSNASTVRKAKATLAPPTPSPVRPTSSASTRSDASSGFKSKPFIVSPKATPRKSVSQEPPNRRERTISTASNASAKSNATAGRKRVPSGERLTPSAPQPLRPRRSSAASAASITVASPKPSTTPKSSTRKLPSTPNGASDRDMALKKSINGSLRPSASNASLRSPESKGRPPLGLDLSSLGPQEEAIGIQLIEPDTPATSGEDEAQEHPSPVAPPAYTRIDTSPSPNRNLAFPIPPADLKGKGKADPNLNPTFASGSHVEDDRPISTTSSIAKTRSDGGSTVKLSRDDANMTPTDTRRRRNSGDTITESTLGTLTSHNTIRAPKRPILPSNLSRPLPPPPTPKRGITLNVGIPCIITSKRSRFRAFAKYIGEVEGERGPWVGVEIPVGGGWGGEKLAGRAWNDGTLNGTKYFEMSANTLEWDEGEQRAARRRRIDILLSDKGSRKREGDHLSTDRERMKRMRSVSPAMSDASATGEVRGLFVRPQQVIYVVDAEH